MDMRAVVKRVVERLGHRVTEAADGLEASHAIDAGGLDLVISDLRMPKADGFAVLRKAQEAAHRVPVIILTASTAISDCVEAMRSGALNFLVKPFDQDELVGVVEVALAQGQP